MNRAVFTGTVTKYEHSHTIKGVKMYEGELEVPRRSGHIDTIPFHSWKNDIQVGHTYLIEGEVKTSRVANGYPKKKTYIKLKAVNEIPAHAVGLNEVRLQGKIAGKNPIRQTPSSHKTVVDFQMILEDKSGNIFPSLIAWGFTAKQIEAVPSDVEIKIVGQFHRREYHKGEDLCVIHEISCFDVEEVK